MQIRDEEVKNLCNRKLWSLIDESNQMRLNNTLVSAVMLELMRRNQLNTDTRWKTFFLLGFGVKSEQNIKACPNTWAAVQKIPGLTTAMFSIFEPGKHLPAHRGPYNGVLRLHLGLIVPEPNDKLAIRVDKQVCHWQEGKALIFDDAYEHEAWNHTDKTRVVLFIDFVKPLKFPARLINWFLLNLAIFTPFIREGLDNHKEWEKKFYAQAEALRNRG